MRKYLLRGKGVRNTKQQGRPQKLSTITKSALVRKALKDNCNATEIQQATDFRVSVRTVQSVLQLDDRMHWSILNFAQNSNHATLTRGQSVRGR